MGTGTFSLNGATEVGYRLFSSVYSAGDTFEYCISNQRANEWEVGVGTFGASATLERTMVKASSNSGALVDFSSGTKNVFVCAAAYKNEQMVTAASTFATDNRLLRSDGTGRGSQASGITVGDDDSIDGATLDDSVVTATGSTTERTLADRAADVVNVKDFGVKADGVTDDTINLQAAITECAGKTLLLPPGTMLISAPLIVDCCLRGVGIELTKIKAKVGFVGTLMVDRYTTGEGRTIEELQFNANDISGLNIYGSSFNGQDGSITLFKKVGFYDCAANASALVAHSTVAAPGTLTGSTFLSCHFDDNASHANIGNNQDDVTFIGCRFSNTKQHTSLYPIKCVGSNISFFGCYFASYSPVYAGITPCFVSIENIYPVKFDGCFFEQGGTSNVAYVFYVAAPHCQFFVTNCHLNMSLGITALMFCVVNTAVSSRGKISVMNVGGVSIGTTVFANVYMQAGATSFLDIFFRSVRSITTAITLGAGSGSVTTKQVTLDAEIDGKMVSGSMGSDLVLSNNGIDNLARIQQTKFSYTTTSSGSPQAWTFNMPAAGSYLVNVCAKIQGNLDHMLNATFLATWYKNINSTYDITQIGSVLKSIGSSYGLTTLTAAMDVDGVVTLTASWTDGVNHPIIFVVNLIRLNDFFLKYLP
jgi:hypothetical protein